MAGNMASALEISDQWANNEKNFDDREIYIFVISRRSTKQSRIHLI